ncbi:MAG: hypothetical protein WD768_12505 [Phycisphaeraceae bacterium]
MSRHKRQRTGFTVPELLAVVAIIIILLSLLLPQLGKAREHARVAICLSGQHQLSVAWRNYANENQSRLVGAHTGTLSYDWVRNLAAPIIPANETEEAIRIGKLWPYINDLALYKCPSDPRTDYLRTYSMSNFVSGTNNWYVEPVLKSNAFRQPGKTMLFIEEPDPRGYNWGSWVIYPKNHASNTAYIDWPASYHYGKAATLSFLDGHSELWIWEDPRTPLIQSFHAVHPNSKDLQRLQEVYNPGEF